MRLKNQKNIKKGNKMKSKEIIWTKPNQLASIVTHGEPTLEEMQEYVGGWIEIVRVKFEGKDCDMVVNEEGKLLGLPVNHFASIVAQQTIVGNAILVKGFKL